MTAAMTSFRGDWQIAATLIRPDRCCRMVNENNTTSAGAATSFHAYNT